MNLTDIIRLTVESKDQQLIATRQIDNTWRVVLRKAPHTTVVKREPNSDKGVVLWKGFSTLREAVDKIFKLLD